MKLRMDTVTVHVKETIGVKDVNKSDRKTKGNLARLQLSSFLLKFPILVLAKVDAPN